MAQIIDGKTVGQKIREELKEEVAKLKEKGVTPGLAAVLVGDDPASQLYVNMKGKACEEVGIYSEKHHLPKETTQEKLIELIKDLNKNEKIHGILVQLPLPGHLNDKEVLEVIDPEKDVDGFHPTNLGRLMIAKTVDELPTFLPCTPAGILKLIDTTGIEIQGKKAVVVGRSVIVGKPTAFLLLARHATVTICHSRTKDLKERCRDADILVAAVGVPQLIRGDMIKPGAVVIDVGVNRTEKGLVGDVNFEEAKEVASYITPVPGGVGPMTIAMLLTNTVKSAKTKVA
jgi:methylenetetrahydrofolate dehydrogenase (NADP+)/methenyltetrahydrofolate cyclohydrolase